MALSNVPVPGQTLFGSRDLINLNFVTIDQAFTVNPLQPQRVPYRDGTGNQGMQNLLQFPVYAGTTNPPVIPAGMIALYNKLSTVTAKNELRLVTQAGKVVETTSSILSINSAPANPSSGWAYFPSGILVKWGNQLGPLAPLPQTFIFPV